MALFNSTTLFSNDSLCSYLLQPDYEAKMLTRWIWRRNVFCNSRKAEIKSLTLTSPRKVSSTTSFLIGYSRFFSATPQRESNNISHSYLYFKNIEISFYKDAFWQIDVNDKARFWGIESCTLCYVTTEQSMKSAATCWTVRTGSQTCTSVTVSTVSVTKSAFSPLSTGRLFPRRERGIWLPLPRTLSLLGTKTKK